MKNLRLGLMVAASLASGFKSTIGQSVNQIDHLGSVIQETETKSKKLGDYKHLQSSTSTLGSTTKSAKLKLGQLHKSLNETKTESIALGQALESSKSALAASQEKANGAKNQFNALNNEYQKAKTRLKVLRDTQKAASNEASKSLGAYRAAQASLKKLESQTDSTSAGTNEMRAAIEKAKKAVEEAKQAHAAKKSSLEEHKEATADLSKTVAELRANLKEAKQTVTETANAHKDAAKAVKHNESALKTNATQQQSLGGQIENSRSRVKRLGEEFEASKNKLKAHRQALEESGLSTKRLSEQHRQLGDELKLLKHRYQQLGDVTQQLESVNERRAAYRAEMADMVALGASMLTPIVAAIRFESVMSDVKKVVQFDKNTDQFKRMGHDILEMSTHIPVAASGLGEIVATAGQAGIARKELLPFTKDISKMAVAFDLTGKQAAKVAIGIRTQFHLTQKELVLLGDAFNHISNNMDATAADMVNVTNRTAASGQLFGLTGSQVGALGAAFLALKSPPEVAATGINALLQKLKTADKQGKKFQQGLSSIGLSARQLKESIKSDAQGTLLSFLEAVKRSDDVVGTLSDLFGMEYSDDIAKLVNGLGEYKKALRLVSNETAYAGSMQREYEEKAKTTENRLTLLKNQANRLGVNLGTVLLPAITSVAKVIGGIADGAADIAQAFPTATKVVIGAAIGLATMKVAAVAGGYAWTFLQGAWLSGVRALRLTQVNLLLATRRLNQYTVATKVANSQTSLFAAGGLHRLGGRFHKFGSSVAGFGTALFSVSKMAIPALIGGIKSAGIALMTTPLGWAIGALSVGALAVYKYWQPIKSFFGGFWQGFKEGLAPIAINLRPIGRLIGWIGDKIGGVVSWFGSLLSPVKMSEEKLKGFATSGQKVGRVFASLANIVTLPFRTALSVIEASVNGIERLGQWIGLIDKPEDKDKDKDQSKDKNKKKATVVGHARYQDDFVPPIAPELNGRANNSMAPFNPAQAGTVTQSVRQVVEPTSTTKLPTVVGHARYQGDFVPPVAPELKGIASYSVAPLNPAQPGTVTQSVRREVEPTPATKLPTVFGHARYQDDFIPPVAPELKGRASYSVAPFNPAQPGTVTQSVRQVVEPTPMTKLPTVVGNVSYQGDFVPPVAPELKGRASYSMAPFNPAQPGAVTQSVRRVVEPTHTTKLPTLIGRAKYKASTPALVGQKMGHYVKLLKVEANHVELSNKQFSTQSNQSSDNVQTRLTVEQKAQKQSVEKANNTYNVTNNFYITVSQQPGEDQDALVERIIAQVELRNRKSTRAGLFDER